MDLRNLSIRLSLSGSDWLRKGSFGEVKKPETINFRTYRPERDGLFCEQIFGPERDFECACGKYKGTKYKGIICDRCGVELTHSCVRRKRMGHINLAAPIVHIWYLKAMPSRLGNLLDIRVSDIEKFIYGFAVVVTDPGSTDLQFKQVLSQEEYTEALQKYGNGTFAALSGGEAVRELLSSRKFRLDEEPARICREIRSTDCKRRRRRLLRRLGIVDAFIEGPNDPKWMVLDVVPVIPPDLRPLVMLESGNFATSDLNNLYRRIINRNNRLKKLMDLNVPEVIIRNEKRMLQQAVDALFDNGRCRRPVLGSSNRPLMSITDMIKGKQGRFRENLLGKRVDYSARSVIVVGPELKLWQCGLPKKIALELYRPFIIRKLKEQGKADTIKSAKRMLERRDAEVWDILETVIKNHPVLLNRAPTLHRMGIQAFEPVLVEGNAIKIHPLVCSSYHAEFDGDQMSVHLPLSVEAQAEAQVLMMSIHNIFSPANGKPIFSPSQDIVMGVYFLTVGFKDKPTEQGDIRRMKDPAEALLAYETKAIDLHDWIDIRLERFSESVEKEKDQPKKLPESRRVVTTLGRLIFNEILPEGMPFYNCSLSKKGAARVIDDTFNCCGKSETIDLLDNMKEVGFRYSTISGASFGLSEVNFGSGGDVCSASNSCPSAAEVSDRIVLTDERLGGSTDSRESPAGLPSSLVAHRRESAAVASRYREIQSADEFLSRHLEAVVTNTRQNMERRDIAKCLTTLGRGAESIQISMRDCGLLQGRPLFQGTVSQPTSLLGTVIAPDSALNLDGPHSPSPGMAIGRELAELLSQRPAQGLTLRSPICCAAVDGVCSLCYGRDLSSGDFPELGSPVGILAAQVLVDSALRVSKSQLVAAPVVRRRMPGHDFRLGNRFAQLRRIFTGKHGSAIWATESGHFRISPGRSSKCWDLWVDSDAGRFFCGCTTDTKSICVQHQQYVTRGDLLASGCPKLVGGATNSAELSFCAEVIKRVQALACSAEFPIADRHIEILVRQMLSQCVVTDPGDGRYRIAKLVDRRRIDYENKARAAYKVVLAPGSTNLVKGSAYPNSVVECENAKSAMCGGPIASTRNSRPASYRVRVSSLSKPTVSKRPFFLAGPKRVVDLAIDSSIHGAEISMGPTASAATGQLIDSGTGLRALRSIGVAQTTAQTVSICHADLSSVDCNAAAPAAFLNRIPRPVAPDGCASASALRLSGISLRGMQIRDTLRRANSCLQVGLNGQLLLMYRGKFARISVGQHGPDHFVYSPEDVSPTNYARAIEQLQPSLQHYVSQIELVKFNGYHRIAKKIPLEPVLNVWSLEADALSVIRVHLLVEASRCEH